MVGGLHCGWMGGAGRRELGAPIFGVVDLAPSQGRKGEQRGVRGNSHQGAVQLAMEADKDTPASSTQGHHPGLVLLP